MQCYSGTYNGYDFTRGLPPGTSVRIEADGKSRNYNAQGVSMQSGNCCSDDTSGGDRRCYLNPGDCGCGDSASTCKPERCNGDAIAYLSYKGSRFNCRSKGGC